MPESRRVDYTLRANTSGVAGVTKFHEELDKLLAVQERYTARVGRLTELREQFAPIRELYETRGKAAREAARAEAEAAAEQKRIGNDYTAFVKQQSAQRIAAAKQEAAESAASAAKIREQIAQVALTAKLAGQADKEAAKVVQAANRERQEAVDGVRLAYSRARAEFDKSSGEARSYGEKIAAAQAYRKAVQELQEGMAALESRTDLTARQMKALSDMQARVAREKVTLGGGVPALGLGANITNALDASLPRFITGLQNNLNSLSPVLQGLSPSLGAAAMNSGQLLEGFTSLTTVAGTLTGGVALAGAAVVGFGLAANKAADEAGALEFEMAKVSTLTDKFPAQMAASGREVLNISRDLGMNYHDIAEGLNQAIGASVRGTEDMTAALAFTAEAGKLAVAGNASTAASVDLLSSVMNSYKLNASQVTQVSDGLFAGIRDGKMSLNELTQSMGNVTAIAASLKVPLSDVNAALATITAGGIRTSTAVDNLRSMFNAIMKPSSEAATLADGLTLKFDAQALASKGLVGFLKDTIAATKGNKEQMAILFQGIEAVSAATSIASGNFERMNTNLRNQANAAGTTETAYTKMMGTLKKENDKLDANWKSLWANMGNAFLPFKTDVVAFMNDALEKLNKFIERMNVVRGVRFANADVLKLKILLDDAQRDKSAATKAISNAQKAGHDPDPYWATRLSNAENAIKALTTQLAAARNAQGQAQSDLTTYDASQAPKTPDPQKFGADLNSPIVAATFEKTGNVMADTVAGWCLRWVKLTLKKANPDDAAAVEKFLGGLGSASDAKNKIRDSGLMRRDLSQLQPGDVVVYDNNHIGIYVGKTASGIDMVRGNNEWGVKNGREVVSSERMTSLGKVAGFLRPSDIPGSTGAPTPDPTSQLKDLKALSTEYTRLTAAYKSGKMDLDAYRNAVSGLRSQAEQLAATQKTGSKEWEKTERFVIQTSNALKTHEAGVKSVTLTWAQWTANREKALALAQREKQLADGKLSPAQSIQLGQDVSAFKKDPVRAAALEEAQRQLAEQKRLREQAKQDTEQAKRDAKEITDARTQAEKQAAVLGQTLLQQRLAGEEAVAKTIEQQRTRRLRQTENDAALTLTVERNYARRSLEQAKDTAQAQLLLAKRAADEAERSTLAAIPEKASKAQRDAITAQAAQVKDGAIRAAYRDYYAFINDAASQGAERVKAAAKVSTNATRELVDALRGAATTRRELASATAAENEQAVRAAITTDSLNGMYAELQALGRTPEASGMLNWLRDVARGQDAAAETARRWLDAYDLDKLREVQVVLQLQAEGNNRVAAEAVKAADDLAGNGDISGGIEELGRALAYLYERASPENGEDAADAINTVTDALNRLTAARADWGKGPELDLSPAPARGTATPPGILNTDTPADARRTDAPLPELGMSAARGRDTSWRADVEAAEYTAEATKKARVAFEGLTVAQLEAAKATAKSRAEYDLIVTIIAEKTQAATDAAAQLAETVDALWDKLNDTPDARRLEDWNTQINTMEEGLKSGALNQQEFVAQAVDALPKLEALAKAAEAQGKTDLAAYYRAGAAALREMGGAALKAAEGVEKLTKLAQEIGDWGKVGADVASMFGGDTAGKAVGYAVNSAVGGLNIFGDFLSGNWLKMAQDIVSWFDNIGKAIDDLIPGVKEMKQGWLDLADAEQQAMGSKVIGGSAGHNGWANPYYESLKADAAALTKKANAGFWERVGWAIFGNAPKTMDKAASEAMQQASIVFNEFGSSLYSAMENSLMDAIDKGDFSNVSKNIEKTLNQFVQRLYVQTLLAKSNLQALVKQLADDQAAGKDTTADQAAIRAELDRVSKEAEAGAPNLPGYGAGAEDSAAAGSTRDTSASGQAQGANFYVANSTKLDMFNADVTRLDDITRRIEATHLLHNTSMDRHSTAMDRHSGAMETWLRDGVRLLDGNGNLLGLLRGR